MPLDIRFDYSAVGSLSAGFVSAFPSLPSAFVSLCSRFGLSKSGTSNNLIHSFLKNRVTKSQRTGSGQRLPENGQGLSQAGSLVFFYAKIRSKNGCPEIWTAVLGSQK